MNKFRLKSKYKPSGDQPQAIKSLVSGLRKGFEHQTLLGVTGSGKTFTVANVIMQVQKPTLVIAHNKTLAAQLCNEFRELFPENSVNYFVSYYDYYQPEAYIPVSDTYIGKEAMINDEIDKLRHAATTALLTRKDVVVVASVSCIYGLGAPEAYAENIMDFHVGSKLERKDFVRKLVKLQFTRTNADLKRGYFRLRGDSWEIMPPDREIIYNLQVTGGEIKEIYETDPVSRQSSRAVDVVISPARHFITMGDEKLAAVEAIRKELNERLKYFEKNGKYLEAERLEQRTKFDLAMIEEVGYCHGIENYSRHLSGRTAGEPPATLLDYFPDDFLTVIDESHITVPQIGGMYEGDASRKKTLIEYGFRLPSAADNRPLRFEEFKKRVGQVIYTSATPSQYELKASKNVAEQIIRPTGLVDPEIIMHPVSALKGGKNQIDDLKEWIDKTMAKKERVMVTTLTKKMAEDLSAYLEGKKTSGEHGRTIKVNYLHSDVKTLDRITILSDFRRGKYDVLVGVNLLREGLDLPEISLVAILDADKEGFLRSETSLIQTIGRAARNVNGKVLLYADVITGSIKRAADVTNRRRKMQIEYNKKHGITPKTIIKNINDIMGGLEFKKKDIREILRLEDVPLKGRELDDLIKNKEKEMRIAAKDLDFEVAALLRDEIRVLLKDSKNIKSKKQLNF
ncbi:MAG: excinuclease ABC subunit UvrB [Candidatus Liptonbacteria bacterium]|nr:excinuclease ABC subunit UvrB [Candidatus Liptonbacteria bacterium]